jgi:hypothetical protein
MRCSASPEYAMLKSMGQVRNPEPPADAAGEVAARCITCGPVSAKIFLEGVEDRLGVVQAKSTYVQCPRCELVFLDPLPTFADTEAFYRRRSGGRRRRTRACRR